VPDAAERVVDPEQLARVVRIPRSDELLRRIDAPHAAPPVVQGAERERRRDRRLAARGLAEQQDKPVVGNRVGSAAVGGGRDERREVWAQPREQRLRLPQPSVVEDPAQVTEAVHARDVPAQIGAALDLLADPPAIEDERGGDAHAGALLGYPRIRPPRHAQVRNDQVRVTQALPVQALDLANLVGEHRRRERSPRVPDELALGDSRPAGGDGRELRVRRVTGGRPRAVECTVAAGIITVREPMERLPEHPLEHDRAQVLERAPSERMQVVIERRHPSIIDQRVPRRATRRRWTCRMCRRCARRHDNRTTATPPTR